MEEILLILSGLIGGFLAGMLGVGGGIIYILILPSALSNAGVCDEQLVAYTIANSLFAIFIASFSANIRSILNNTFMYKEVLSIGVLNVIFGIFGMKYIVQTDWYSKDLFNVIIVLILGGMLFRMLIISKEKENNEIGFNVSKMGITGASAGLISALSGLGGGVVIVPMLQNFFNMDIKKAKTISLGVIGLMAFSLTVFNVFSDVNCVSTKFQTGFIVYPVTLIMCVGVLIGTPLGVKVAKMTSSEKLKITFSIILLLVIIKKIYELAVSYGYL